jgi:hypothetical protein
MNLGVRPSRFRRASVSSSTSMRMPSSSIATCSTCAWKELKHGTAPG